MSTLGDHILIFQAFSSSEKNFFDIFMEKKFKFQMLEITRKESKIE